jgi:hypothetical protein
MLYVKLPESNGGSKPTYNLWGHHLVWTSSFVILCRINVFGNSEAPVGRPSVWQWGILALQVPFYSGNLVIDSLDFGVPSGKLT